MTKRMIKFSCTDKSNLYNFKKEVKILSDFSVEVSPLMKIKNLKKQIISSIFEKTSKLIIHKDISNQISFESNGVILTDDDTIKNDNITVVLNGIIVALRIKRSRTIILVPTIITCINLVSFLKKEVDKNINSIILKDKSFDNKTIIDKIMRFDIVNSIEVVKSATEKICNEYVQSNACATIYLIRTREFLNQNLPVFKIGKTKNEIHKRLGGYGKGGEILFSLGVEQDELNTIENQLIDLFKTRFTQRCDIGTEYFQGEWKEMRALIYEHITGSSTDNITTEDPIFINSDSNSDSESIEGESLQSLENSSQSTENQPQSMTDYVMDMLQGKLMNLGIM